MRILKKDLGHGKLVVQAQNLDDLWCLSQSVRKGDVVIGKTTRKVRLGSAEEAVKKQYVLSVAVEDVEFKEQSLRLSGKTTEAMEDIPKGSHHTITTEPNDILTIIKESWQKYELDRIDQATQVQLSALIVIFDRELCLLARLKSRGYEIITELKGRVRKKGYELKKNEIESIVGVPVHTMIPFDNAVMESVNKKQPVVHMNSSVNNEFRRLAAVINGEKVEIRSGFWSRLLGR